MTSDTQTLDVGRSIAQQYDATFGYRDVTQVPHLHASSIVIASRGGSGKSQMILSCPYGLVLNLDGASLPEGRKAIAYCIPYKNDEGRLVKPGSGGPDPSKGVDFPLTWEGITDYIQNTLIKNKNNPNRPRMIFFDTVDALFKLAQDYARRDPAAWALGRDPKPTFQALGMSAWGAVNEKIIQLRDDLLAAGYGVCMCVRLYEKVTTVDEITSDRTLTYLPDKLWGMIHLNADLVLQLEIEDRMRQVEKTRNVGGQTRTIRESESYTARVLYPHASTKHQVAKSRRALPSEIVVPAENGWSVLEAAYKQSIMEPNTNEQ